MLALHREFIEVAPMPKAVNAAAAREKSTRHGHPNTLHPWWTRHSRALLFVQMGDTPSLQADVSPTSGGEDEERRRLFGIIKAVTKWGRPRPTLTCCAACGGDSPKLAA